jgi:hypothetical protein
MVRTYAEVRGVRPYLQKAAGGRAKRYFVLEGATCSTSFVLVLVLVLMLLLLSVFGLGLGWSAGRHTRDLPTFCLERVLANPLASIGPVKVMRGKLRWGKRAPLYPSSVFGLECNRLSAVGMFPASFATSHYCTHVYYEGRRAGYSCWRLRFGDPCCSSKF